MEDIDNLIYDAISEIRHIHHKRPDEDSIAEHITSIKEIEKITVKVTFHFKKIFRGQERTGKFSASGKENFLMFNFHLFLFFFKEQRKIENCDLKIT